MLIALEDRADGPEGRQGLTNDAARGTRLADDAVADLAEEMWIPQGLFRAVIDRYPELHRVLARRYRRSTCTA